MSAQPNSFDVIELDGITHYLPHEGFYRRALVRAVDIEEIKDIAEILLAAYLNVREKLLKGGASPVPEILLLEEADLKGLETEELKPS